MIYRDSRDITRQGNCRNVGFPAGRGKFNVAPRDDHSNKENQRPKRDAGEEVVFTHRKSIAVAGERVKTGAKTGEGLTNL